MRFYVDVKLHFWENLTLRKMCNFQQVVFAAKFWNDFVVEREDKIFRR